MLINFLGQMTEQARRDAQDAANRQADEARKAAG